MSSAASEVPALWDMDSADYECDCPGPPKPPEFRLPPPPRPPFLSELDDCTETSLEDIETCDIEPSVIDAEPSILPALPSLAIMGLFSLLLLTFILVAAALLCKHKKKMQNLLPCKSSPQNRCDVTHGNGVIYEDLTNIRPRTLPQPSIEMLDVKNYPHHQQHILPHHTDHHYVTSNHYPSVPMMNHQPVFICSRPSPNSLYLTHPANQDLYNPVYEELSNGSAERGDSEESENERIRGVSSEDDFAEDELSGAEQGGSTCNGPSSLLGSTGNDLCRDLHMDNTSDLDICDRSKFLNNRNKHMSLPQNKKSRPSNYLRSSNGSRTSGRSRSTNTSTCGPNSLDRRRRGGENNWRNPPEAYHEGLLVDALMIMQQSVNHRPPYVVPVPQTPCNPYQSVPVIPYNDRHGPHDTGNMSSFRPMLSQNLPTPPKMPSQDSDSGYSNNTSGGGQSTSTRGTHRGKHKLNCTNENIYS